MKRRVRKIANFFAFNLLFFALYLNFIHKDKSAIGTPVAPQTASAAFSGNVAVDNSPSVNKSEAGTASVSAPQPAVKGGSNVALKLSIN
ncbi:MAG: hypothetical protein JNM88_09770 [Chitinophagaceae bacterium]|nr:hypothetical protein [Chitinophagaceae bacterium]